MPLEDIHEVRAYLDAIGQYGVLLARYDAHPDDRSVWFEMVFAYWCHDKGLAPEYEVNVNPAVAKTVDFCVEYAGRQFNMELVRVENSAAVQQHMNAQENGPGGIYQLLLHSDAENPYFRTAAQLIRLQEKILGKVDKFAVLEENRLSLVVVDCTNINAGMLDAEDVRMVAYGRSMNPFFQEYWEGQQLKGVFDGNLHVERAGMLRERLSAIVFLQKLAPNGLERLFVASNPLRDIDEELIELPIFDQATPVKPVH